MTGTVVLTSNDAQVTENDSSRCRLLGDREATKEPASIHNFFGSRVFDPSSIFHQVLSQMESPVKNEIFLREAVSDVIINVREG